MRVIKSVRLASPESMRGEQKKGKKKKKKKTIMANLRLGSWIRKVHEIRRMATGLNA